jgi:hypothetical protein
MSVIDIVTSPRTVRFIKVVAKRKIMRGLKSRPQLNDSGSKDSSEDP